MNPLLKLALLAGVGAFLFFFGGVLLVYAGLGFKQFVLDAWLFWVIIAVLLLHWLATPRL